MPDIQDFGIQPLTCHGWNKDRTQIAVSLNNNEVQIHKQTAGKWTLTESLSEHGQRVTGIDWAPNSNLIVTCAADRNAYVWTLQADKKTWKPTLVVLRINRAATCVRWSPLENKFACGSGAKLISVCYFDKDNNWWTSRQIKKQIRSTVTCLDWHPNNVLLACGTTGFKTRVISSWVKEVDEKPGATSWGSKMPFGNVMAEFSSGGWVRSVSFSDNGDLLAWVSHDSTVAVVDASKSQKLTVITTEYLPFMMVTWVNDTNLAVAGFDCSPMTYKYDGNDISFVSKIDSSAGKPQTGGKVSAMARFQQLDSKAAVQSSADTKLSSTHQNTITHGRIHSGTKSRCSKLSTGGADGKLVIWDI